MSPAGLPPPLDERRDEVWARLAGRRPALFLDYDGTLAPIVADPDRAVMTPAMRATVADLAGRCPVALVSGRDLAKLKALAGLDGVAYAGSHGFEIEGPGIRDERGREFLPALDAAEAALRRDLAAVPGARVERKRYAIAAHWRQVDAALVPQVDAAVARALQPGLCRSGGKKVFELRPALDWDKGRAVLWLLQALGLAGPEVLPIYVGDDETDEDAFRALAGRGLGIAVRDAPVPTAADYVVPDTEAVRRLLADLAARLAGP